MDKTVSLVKMQFLPCVSFPKLFFSFVSFFIFAEKAHGSAVQCNVANTEEPFLIAHSLSHCQQRQNGSVGGVSFGRPRATPQLFYIEPLILAGLMLLYKTSILSMHKAGSNEVTYFNLRARKRSITTSFKAASHVIKLQNFV